MNAQRVVRGVVASLVTLLVLTLAVPAAAQMGSVKGKVVDDTGKPVPDADIVFEFVGGDVDRKFTGKTDRRGEFIRAGLLVAGGRWRISATTKDGKSGRSEDLDVPTGGVFTIPDIVLKAGKPAATAAPDPKMSKEEVEKVNRRNADLAKRFTESKADMDAGNYDAAIAKLEELTKAVEKCDACYIRMGDAYARKKDLAGAEKAFLQAIAINEKNPDPYGALATIYNEQKKFAEATTMGEKAASLQAASGGPVDPVALYNQGVILWNQSKGPEAAAMFAKAVAADPRNADAQYLLGLTLFSSGKPAEAKAPLTEYLKLAPTGTNAATAKALLAEIK